MTVAKFQHINLDYLNMMTDGDADMRSTMLLMISEEVPDELKKMNEAANSGDWQEVFQISHKMKTTLAFIGNDGLTNLNKEIEHSTRNNIHLNEVLEKVQRLTKYSEPMLSELEQLL